MPTTTLFKLFYWIALIIEMAVRVPLNQARRKAATTERRISTLEFVLLSLLSLTGFFLPLVYTFTPWLRFADYTLPPALGWLGVPLLACAVYLFIRAHRDLAANWSPSLEIFSTHRLVTHGIYRHIRHPMYASQWLLVFAQLLLLQNWLAGPTGLLLFIPFYFLRVRAEEQMMLDTFGEQYNAYRRSTGAVFPRL